jgi:hypothetical protein
MDAATYWLVVLIVGIALTIPLWVWLLHDLAKRKRKAAHPVRFWPPRDRPTPEDNVEREILSTLARYIANLEEGLAEEMGRTSSTAKTLRELLSRYETEKKAR